MLGRLRDVPKFLDWQLGAGILRYEDSALNDTKKDSALNDTGKDFALNDTKKELRSD